MRDWLRTGSGSPPAPVRRDHLSPSLPREETAPDQGRPAMRSSRLSRLRARIPALLVGTNTLLILASAAALIWVPGQLSDAGPALAAAPSAAVTPSVPVTRARPAEQADTDAEAAPPRRVTIDRIGVDSTLIGLRVQRNGELEVPADYGVAGWHRAGTAPGDRGPAVLVGHVDSFEGPAVFYRLRELQPGDRATVTRTDGSVVTFEVYGVERYAKKDFPTDAVYGATDGPELRLVTCGGAFDEKTRSYQDNVVAYARLVPAEPKP